MTNGAEPLDYSAWVQAIRPTLVRFATLTLNGSADAEDICQGVLVRMADGFARFPDAGAALAYARRSVVNAVIDLRRHEQRERRVLAELAAEQHRQHAVAGASDDARTAVEALELLGARDRAALALRYHDGLSHREVAEALGVTEITARAICSRALKRLRHHLEEADHAH